MVGVEEPRLDGMSPKGSMQLYSIHSGFRVYIGKMEKKMETTILY